MQSPKCEHTFSLPTPSS